MNSVAKPMIVLPMRYMSWRCIVLRFCDRTNPTSFDSSFTTTNGATVADLSTCYDSFLFCCPDRCFSKAFRIIIEPSTTFCISD